ncbi:MAG: TolC family protein [Deltaproteobacteria bacterium]|nr:TolC family protein [Deltaproteobacteria bacterium]
MRMAKLSVVLAALVLGAAGYGHAQEPQAQAKQLRLSETLAIAVRQSPTLAQFTLDVAVADARITEASGFRDFVLDGSVNWLSSRSKPAQGQFVFDQGRDQVTVETGVSKIVGEGGQLALRLEGEFNPNVKLSDELAAIVGRSEVNYYSPRLTLSFKQPLLRGLSIDQARAGQDLARVGRDAAVLQQELTASNTVRDVVQAYWDLSYSVEELEIRKQSLALAREQLRMVQAGIDVGKLAPSASAEVEATIALRDEEVLVAEQALSERALELRRLAGMEIGPGEVMLEATDRPEPVAVEPDLDRALASAMERNPQLLAVRTQVRSASIEVEVAENGLLPQLDFSASGSKFANSTEVGDAFTDLLSTKSYSVQAGLTFSTPLGRHQAKGSFGAARNTLRKVRMTEADIRAQIAVAVVRAANLVRSSKKRIEVLTKSTELAEINLNTEKARYDVGRATNFDVLKRQEELAQAQLRQARAKTDYLKAVAVLEALTGEILPRHGIQLAPAS